MLKVLAVAICSAAISQLLLVSQAAGALTVNGAVSASESNSSHGSTLPILGLLPVQASGDLSDFDGISAPVAADPLLAPPPVPEPGSLVVWSLLAGIAGLALLGRRFRRISTD